ncbi:MAG: transporter substrate-binding domain-containing protein [Desulfosalsimonas sp.]
MRAAEGINAPHIDSFADSAAGGEIDLTPEEKSFLEEHPVFRVGNEDDWPPFDFSEHGRPKGYAIEYLQLLARRLGISFEYVNGYTWFELLGLFRDKKIDLLPCLWISGNRKQFMTFTAPYLELPYVVVAGKEDQSIRAFEDLKGKTVAAARGYKQEEVLQSSYPEIKVFQVQNALQGLEAVLYGEADAYIGYQGTVAYLMATRFLGSLRVCGEVEAPELGPQGLHMAVRPEMELLAGILEKAMETVTEKEKVELAQKWISTEQTRLPDLTTREKVFLRKNPVLKVDNLENWPPFNFNEKGRTKGFCVDYMNLLADKLGIGIEYVPGSRWGKFMDMLETGDLDCLSDVVETPDRKKTIAFTEPYFTIFSGIVVRKGNERFTRLKDLSGRKVAVPGDFYYQEILERHYPEVRIVAETDTLDCLKAVSSGKVDAALSEKPVFDYLISKHFLSDLKSVPIMDSDHFENTQVSIGVRKDRKILREILQKAMDAVTREEQARLYRRWLNQQNPGQGRPKILLSGLERQWLEEKEEISVAVHPSRPPFEELDSNGTCRGISPDIFSILEERIGVPIRVIPTGSWQESIEALEEGRCDLLSGASRNSREAGGFAVSKPYIESVNVMVVRDGQPYLQDLHALEGKTLAVVRGNPVKSYFEDRFPRINLSFHSDLNNALKDVARGGADAAVGSLHRVSHAIHELGLYDLKIAGQTPYKESLGLGLRNDDPILSSIINKALESLSDREVSQITSKWLSVRYDKGVDTALLFQVLGGAALLMCLFFFWNRKLARLNRRLGIAHEALAVKSSELERLSTTDALTGIFNRMKMEDLLESEINRVRRTGSPFSLIMLDVDHFKDINDSYGHQAGDSALQEVSGLLKQSVRQADSLGRWGGEELMILCPETSGKGAAILAEHLRRVVAARKLTVGAGITCSFGVAEYRPGEGINQILGRVDRAMYRAKKRGRNRVETA